MENPECITSFWYLDTKRQIIIFTMDLAWKDDGKSLLAVRVPYNQSEVFFTAKISFCLCKTKASFKVVSHQ